MILDTGISGLTLEWGRDVYLPWMWSPSGVVCGSLALLTLLVAKYGAKPLPDLPRPIHYPFLGVLVEVARNQHRLMDWLSDTTRAAKNRSWTMSGPVDNTPFVVVTTGENLEHVLKSNFSNYVKGERLHFMLRDFLGEGIFATDGEKWRDHRKIASHMFSMRILKSDMFRVFVSQSNAFLSVLEKLDDGQSIDLGSLFYRFTMDAMCEVSFGLSLGTLTQDDPFASAFDGVQNVMALRHIDPSWRIARWLNIGKERELKENMKTVNEFCYRVIRERREKIERDHEDFDPTRTYPDLLSCFMSTWRIRGEDKSDEYYRDVICNFMIAGRDTTAGLLSWFFYELHLNTPVLTKIRQEIDLVCPSGVPTYEELKLLVYLEAAVSAEFLGS